MKFLFNLEGIHITIGIKSFKFNSLMNHIKYVTKTYNCENDLNPNLIYD